MEGRIQVVWSAFWIFLARLDQTIWPRDQPFEKLGLESKSCCPFQIVDLFRLIWSCYVLSLTTLTNWIDWILAILFWQNWFDPLSRMRSIFILAKIEPFVPALINKTVSHCVRWQRFFVYTNLLLVQTISRPNIFNLQGTRIEKGKKELPSPGDRYQYPFKIVWF